MNQRTPSSPAKSRPNSREDLIAQLTEDLTPVRRIRPLEGAMLLAAATLVASLASIAYFGWWSGLLAGQASGYFLITHGLLAVLGVASGLHVVLSAMPRIGSRADSALWSTIMLGIVPLVAIVNLAAGNGDHAHEGLNDHVAAMCTVSSLLAGSLVLGASVLWLRRGAPVSIERAGWLAGLAAGSLGTLAYGITCPLDTLSHVGMWHIAPVAIAAVAGRLIVPPLIRW